MKRIFHFVSIFCFGVLISGGCSKNNDDAACKTLAQDVSIASQLYASNPSAINCGYFKTAIQNYLNSPCADKLSNTDRQSLQNQLNNLNC